jgi:hypothetical protein
LRESTDADQTTSASFAASDGCMRMPAISIQLRLPLTSTPSGVNTSSCPTRAPTMSGQASACHVAGRSRAATTMSGSPIAANIAWRRNTA